MKATQRTGGEQRKVQGNAFKHGSDCTLLQSQLLTVLRTKSDRWGIRNKSSTETEAISTILSLDPAYRSKVPLESSRNLLPGCQLLHKLMYCMTNVYKQIPWRTMGGMEGNTGYAIEHVDYR